MENKFNQVSNRQSRIPLLVGLILLAFGGPMTLISLIVFFQPVSEMDLWPFCAIPFLFLGGLLLLGGLITTVVGLIVRLWK